MNKQEIKYKKFLRYYNLYKDKLQKKNKFIYNELSLLNEQLKLIDSIIKNLNSENKIKLIDENSENKDYFYEIMQLINESFITMMISDKQIIKELISNLSKLLDIIKKENIKYDIELESIYNQMKEEEEKLEHQKKLFYDSIKETESSLLNVLNGILEPKKKSNESFQFFEIIKEPKNNYINYITGIDNVNKIINQFNEKEKHIFYAFDYIDKGFNLITSYILKQFYENQTIKFNFTSKNKKIIKEMIITNNNNILNNQSKDISLIQHKYSLDLIQYENFPSKIDFCNIENNKEFKIYLYIVEFLNGNIGNIYPNFSVEKETKRNDLREKIINLISNLDIKITEEDKNELFELLKNDEENQKLFINELNKLRVRGHYQSNKEIKDLIGHCLNIILNYLLINQNYDIAKNCIILSQTFYYEIGKEKTYIYKLIRDHQLFHKEDFWKNCIDLLITKEFLRYQNILKEQNINIFMNNNIPSYIENKKEEILFAQLAPNINNMIEFKVDKKIILKITEEFIHKYDYLKQKKIDTIYNLISDNKEEIKKIKEEIQNENLLKSNKNYIENIKDKNNNQENILLEINDKKEEENKILELNNTKEKKNKILEIIDKKEEENNILELNHEKEGENNIFELNNKEEEKNKIKDSNDKQKENKIENLKDKNEEEKIIKKQGNENF